jgi:hypothetical protein
MLGLKELGQKSARQRADAVLSALQAKRAMGRLNRQWAKTSYGIKGLGRVTRKAVPLRLAKVIRSCRKCDELAQQFKVVSLDKEAKRKVKVLRDGYKGYEIEVPLLFSTRLPTKPIYSLIVDKDSRRYTASARVPSPPPEAIQAIKEHGQKFDWLELWWVPSDVQVEQMPQPDPIVVGAIQIPNDIVYYFELHRWIDESVELGYWSKEGY